MTNNTLFDIVAGKTIINGQVYTGRVTVTDKVIINNGVETPLDTTVFNISVVGDVKSLSVVNGHVDIIGDVDRISTMSGDVTVDGDVNGGIETMSGDIEIEGNVGGSVSSMSGDVSRGT